MIATLRVAWVSDDAFISARAALNAASGLGLVLNPPERVLGFTNPFWTLLLVPLVWAGLPPYWALMLLAVGCSVLFGVLFAWQGRKGPAGYAGALVLASFSQAFAQFSASGLENPLSHLLLVLFVTSFLSGTNPRRTWLLLALVGTNRLDHLTLVLPCAVWMLFGRLKSTPKQSVRIALRVRIQHAGMGLVPLLAWEVFSLIYYGFLTPNTAAAKLTTTISSSDVVRQGAWYLMDAVMRDPITVLVIVGGLAALFLERRAENVALALGVICYLVYVLRIGGDFMAGRLLTAPFAIALAVLARSSAIATVLRRPIVLAPALVLFVLFPGPFGDLQRFDCGKPASGIVDERRCYAEYTGLSENVRAQKYKTHAYWAIGEQLRASPERVHISMLVGMTGVAAGPKVHIIDEYGLTDPLLARVPYQPEPEWRIGHFRRAVPEGYLQTLETGRNEIANPCLRAYYAVLWRVVRGPVFSSKRWYAIAAVNGGGLDHLLQPECTDARIPR